MKKKKNYIRYYYSNIIPQHKLFIFTLFQPQVPLRLPCYDFTSVMNNLLDIIFIFFNKVVTLLYE